jgi:hypothetical protein
MTSQQGPVDVNVYFAPDVLERDVVVGIVQKVEGVGEVVVCDGFVQDGRPAVIVTDGPEDLEWLAGEVTGIREISKGAVLIACVPGLSGSQSLRRVGSAVDDLLRFDVWVADCFRMLEHVIAVVLRPVSVNVYFSSRVSAGRRGEAVAALREVRGVGEVVVRDEFVNDGCLTVVVGMLSDLEWIEERVRTIREIAPEISLGVCFVHVRKARATEMQGASWLGGANFVTMGIGKLAMYVAMAVITPPGSEAPEGTVEEAFIPW